MVKTGTIERAVSSGSPGCYQHRGRHASARRVVTNKEEPQPPARADMLAHLSAIVDACDDAFVSASLDGTTVLWNPCAETLFGYSAAEAVGRPVSLLLPPDRSEESELLLARIAGGERIDHFETVRIRKDGSSVDVSLSAFPVKDASGRVIGAAVIARDITEQKRIERELQRWRNQLQAIVQGVDDAVVVRGPGGEVVYANDNAARLLGFASVAELIETPIARTHERFEFCTESGQLIPASGLPGVLALQGVEMPPAVLRFRLLGTGEERWAVVKAVPITGDDGQVQYSASIFSDITQRKQAEEALKVSEARFQAFMHNTPIVAYMKDEAGRVVFLNHAWEQLFGIPIAEAIGKDDFELQPQDLAEQFHAADVEVLETGKAKVIAESVTASDGTLRHWMTFKFPIVLPSGARFVGGASVEITERVQAEQELQRYAGRLQTLSRQLIEAQEAERLRISRDLHDQVGQSLTAIKIDLQVAQHHAATTRAAPSTTENELLPDGRHAEGTEASQKVYTEVIERLGKGIAMVERTIQQVREFSLDLRPSILDDLGLPSALLWYAEEQARRAGFQTQLAIEHLPSRLSPELEITCFRVAQEALTNVVRHARARRVYIEFRHSGENIVLTVSDDGTGFDPQALAADTPAQSDTGNRHTGGDAPNKVAGERGDAKESREMARIKTLGLAGMNERVLLVGGSLSMESAPGKGTRVRAVFPLSAFPRDESTRI